MSKPVAAGKTSFINLHGRYEFQKPPHPLDVDAIIRELTGFRSDHHLAQAV
jgi:hypothetical protein